MKKKDRILMALEDSPIKKAYSSRDDITAAQTALIALTIDILGGPTAFGKLLSIHRQAAINYRNRGHIPVKYQRVLVEKFSIQPALLDYDTARFYNPAIKPWIKLIKDSPFFEKYQEYLMGFTAP